MTIANLETLTRFLTNTNSTSFTAANLLILDNKYYEQIVGRIISETAGARWQFGDFNYTAFPTFTLDMVNSTAEYSLTDLSTDPLTIMGVEVLDNSGIWHKLDRTSLREIHTGGNAQVEYYKTDGRPQEYEIRDSELVLYPAPDNGVNVTLTAGLKIFYLRTADKFTPAQQTTGTKEPGFPSPWHDMLSYGPAYDYALSNPLAKLPAGSFKAEYERKMEEMLDFISHRDQADEKVITIRKRSFR